MSEFFTKICTLSEENKQPLQIKEKFLNRVKQQIELEALNGIYMTEIELRDDETHFDVIREYSNKGLEDDLLGFQIFTQERYEYVENSTSATKWHTFLTIEIYWDD